MSLFTVLGDEAKALLTPFFASFVQDDIGKLAVAAVQFAEAEYEGIAGEDADETKRDVAKTNLLNAAEAAGKDLAREGEAVLNALIETAIQAGAISAVTAAVSSI